MVDLFTEKIEPQDIALLIGLPCDANAFLSDIALRKAKPTDGRGDYAAGQIAIGKDEKALARTHAALLADLLETAKAARIPESRIFEAARLDDINSATESGAKVLILLAHYRSVDFSKADLSPFVGVRLEAGMAGRQETVARLLSDYFVRARASPSTLSLGALSDLLSDFVLRFGTEDEQMIVRDALDAVFGDCFAPGNAVELRDGVYKADQFAAELSQHWSGIFDLAVCHSFHLAHVLRAGREDRRIIANKKQKMLDRVVPELCEVFAQLACARRAYIPLKAKTHSIYSELIPEVH